MNQHKKYQIVANFVDKLNRAFWIKQTKADKEPKTGDLKSTWEQNYGFFWFSN